MKSYIGNGSGNPTSAVNAAIRGLTNPKMILFMTNYQDAREVASLIKEKYPNIPSIGTIGTKIANGNVGDQNLIVLGLFDDVEVSCGLIKGLSKCPITYISEIESNLKKVNPGKEDTVCIEYCTGKEENLISTFQICLEKKSIPLAGGSVFGVPDGKDLIVCYEGQVYEDACVYAFIKNKTGRVKVYKENIYERRSKTAHFATKVDVENRALIELDGRKASTVYSEELNIPQNQIVGNVFSNPMGRVVGDQVFISSMKELDRNGNMINYKRINQNDCIYFLELGDYKAIEKETRSTIQSQMHKISLVISIDCIYRYLMYQKEDYFQTYARDMSTLGPHIGVVGGGEQFNNQHVNQTMVCAVFE